MKAFGTLLLLLGGGVVALMGGLFPLVVVYTFVTSVLGLFFMPDITLATVFAPGLVTIGTMVAAFVVGLAGGILVTLAKQQ